MKNVAFTRNVAHEPIAHAKALFEFLLGADKNVNRKSWMTLQMNLPLPADGASFRSVA